MKNRHLKLLLLLIIFQTSYSQSVKFGIKAGLNYANTTGSQIKTDAITSYHVGLVTEVRIGKSFAIQPELLYTTQGTPYKTATKEFKNELGYIQYL